MATRAGLSFEKVVETAIRIADKNGLNNLTLGRFAHDVGVKTPSLYEHINGLPGLQQAIRLRRRIVNDKPQPNQYVVLAILITGLIILVVGGYKYVYEFPAIPNLTIAGYGFVSGVIGLAAGYFFVRLRKKYSDLSM
jgi:hypothetical protein